jgi:hypothetical protein
MLGCFEISASEKLIWVSLKIVPLGKHEQFVSMQKRLYFTRKMG